MRLTARSATKVAAFVSLASIAFFVEIGPREAGDDDREPESSPTSAAVQVPTATVASAPTTTTEPSQSGVQPTGEFRVVPGTTAPVGTGRLVTYRVELETGLTLVDAVVAGIVDTTLAEPRSWTAPGDVQLQRVDGEADVVVRLATPPTVDRLCLPLRTNGVFSCHSNGSVNLNVVRWQEGSEEWPLPMTEYRAYMVNHEFGHVLGHGHVACPGVGAVAPVMMQQTKGLDGCLANAWPYP